VIPEQIIDKSIREPLHYLSIYKNNKRIRLYGSGWASVRIADTSRIKGKVHLGNLTEPPLFRKGDQGEKEVRTRRK